MAVAKHLMIYWSGDQLGNGWENGVLLIVWHSRTGAAASMAQAVWAGAAEDDAAVVRLIPATHVCVDDMLAANAYVFVCPENLGGMTGEMKAFLTDAIIQCWAQSRGADTPPRWRRATRGRAPKRKLIGL